MRRIAETLAAAAVALYIPQAAATSSSHSTMFPDVTWDSDAWTLTTTRANNSDWHTQSFVSNGYIGSSFASTGPFPVLYSNTTGQWWLQDYGTFGTVAGFFNRGPITKGEIYKEFIQYGWGSDIAGLPCWGPLVLDFGGDAYLDGTVDLSELSNIVLQQDFRKGTANYAYTWTPSSLDGVSVNVSFMAVADKLHPNRAYIHMNLASESSISGTVVNILDGSAARRTDFQTKGIEGDHIYSAVSPSGVNNVTAWTYASLGGTGVDMSTLLPVTDRPYISDHPATIAQSVQIDLQPHKTISLTKYVGIASNDAFELPDRTAYHEMLMGQRIGFDTVFQQHVDEWAKVLPDESVTSFVDPATGEVPAYLMDRQIATIVASANLIMNTVGENALNYVQHAPINTWGIGVCGLTSDCYGGQQFWDQDIWMAPYLATSHPFEAKQISLSRTTLYDQALANMEAASRSTSKGDIDFSPQAAIYPWSTGRDGNCTAVGPCWDFEYHVNGDIVQGFVHYWAASGDDAFFRDTLLPITNSVATLFSEIIELNSTTNTWILKNMTDPDEYAMNVDNGAFTMAIMQWTFRTANFFNGFYGKPQNPTWEKQAAALEIPMNEHGNITLEYTGMQGDISIKQADVILRTYPLDNHENYPLDNQIADVDYYAAKQDQEGPGMTYAIFSIDSSALAQPGCSAYTYDRYSWTPYARAPWFAFSEQMDDYGTSYPPAYPFMTGFGGFLQVDLMGYLGLRYDTSHKLKVFPNLPPQIPHMRLPTFYFHGWPIQAEMNQTHTTLTRLETPLPTANMSFMGTDITVFVTAVGSPDEQTFHLPAAGGGSLVLKNYNASCKPAIDNNILQCRPIATFNGTILPGQFAEGAIDGSTSTKWQTTSAKSVNSMTVDLGDDSTTITTFAPVKSIFVDWAAAVPSSFAVVFHNSSISKLDEVDNVGHDRIDMPNVDISIPYNASEQKIVQRYQGNTTSIDLLDSGREVWTGRYATLLVVGNQGDDSDSAPGASVAEWAVIV
ncbi:hypothetical protein GX50_06828 [[Emmonsia] crescens]|uniref:alpha,alpha-trehalase n=1 Tax=[Emmonsia] crescens TaxID=73230 RepID=A0A2B7ZBL9_9EURO|nr:hypothetical protein GX50_06828 [Emmonsia crescens]